MDITEDFISFLRESFDDDSQKTLPEEILMDTCLKSLEGWDSMTLLALTVILEEEVNVSLENKDFKGCVTVQDLYNTVEAKL